MVKRSQASLAAVTLIFAAVSSVPAVTRAQTFSYYIGEEVVVVDVAATVKVTRQIEAVPDGRRKDCKVVHASATKEFCVTESTVITREGAAASRLIPDPNLAVPVSDTTPALVDDHQVLELREGMLLASINATSVGRAGDVITSIAKFAGIFLGRLPVRVDATPPPPVQPPTVPISKCDPFAAAYRDLPDTMRLWLWENTSACSEWGAITKLSDARQDRVDDRLMLEEEIKSASGAELKVLLQKVKVIDEAVGKIDKEIKGRKDSFDAQFSVFAQQLRLGSTTETTHFNSVLDFRELPPGTGLQVGMPFEQVDDKAKSYPASARELWNRANLIVSSDTTGVKLKPAVGDQPPECATPVSVPSNTDTKKTVQIAFRQGTPARLRVWIADQRSMPGDQPGQPLPVRLRLIADQWQNVVHPCLGISTIKFSRSIWAKREVSLTFDERGRPLRLDRSTGSDGAAIAAAIAGAATAVRDEYATTLNKAAAEASDRRTIELAELTTRVEKLKKEKDILDAQLQVDVSRSGHEASFKRQQAAADLAQLEAELSLQTAQAAAEQKAQIEQLKVSLDHVNKQIELLKAQQQLQTLQDGRR